MSQPRSKGGKFAPKPVGDTPTVTEQAKANARELASEVASQKRTIEQLQSERAKLREEVAEAEAHAANLQAGNIMLARDLSEAEQGRDIAVAERDQFCAALESEERGNLLGTLGVAGVFSLIIGLVAFFVGRAL